MFRMRGKVVDEEGRRLTAYLPSSMVEEGHDPPHPRFATFCTFKASSGFAVFFWKQSQLSSIVISIIAILWLQHGVFNLTKSVCSFP